LLTTPLGHRILVALEDESGESVQVQVQSSRAGGAA